MADDDFVEVKTLDEFQKTITDNKSVVVFFHAAWCGFCVRIIPQLKEIIPKNGIGLFIKVDMDEAMDIAEKFNVTSTPTFIAFKGGNEFDRFVGSNKGEIENLLLRCFNE